MTEEQKAKVNTLFDRWGSPQQSSDVRFSIYVNNPDYLDKTEDIERNIKRAQEDINRFEKYIDILKTYQIALVEKYNEVLTAPKQMKAVLKRDRNYYDKHVYYYITTYEINLDTGVEVLKDSKRYAGKDKKQAFADFEQMHKENKNWIFEKDIDKKQWEK